MNFKRINVERLILLFLAVFTIFLVISHIQVTADLNQKILRQKKQIESRIFKLEQDKSFLEERVNLLTEAFKDIKK